MAGVTCCVPPREYLLAPLAWSVQAQDVELLAALAGSVFGLAAWLCCGQTQKLLTQVE